jgi:hypothetical protein
MADGKRKRDGADWRRVARGQPCELAYFAASAGSRAIRRAESSSGVGLIATGL